MSKKRYYPEEIIGKLREADVLLSQGKKVVDVIKKKLMVPEEGVEPSQPCGYGILSPARLPVPPLRPESKATSPFGKVQERPPLG